MKQILNLTARPVFKTCQVFVAAFAAVFSALSVCGFKHKFGGVLEF